MSDQAFLQLKANAKGRVLAGHPWVFANEVEALPASIFDGEVIECRDRRGKRLGDGIYNSRSQIVWRKLGTTPTELNEGYLRRTLGEAVGNAQRLIYLDLDRNAFTGEVPAAIGA